MIHNKYFIILEQFLGNYTKEIYGRELVGKISLSQKAIALYLERLENEGILTSRKQGNMKYFHLNIQHSEIKDIILSIELVKKIHFLKKERKIATLLKQDKRIVGIFGSYAKGTYKKDSDIDLFIIGKKIKEDYEQMGKTFDLNISVKYFNEEQFKDLLKKKNPLCNEIIKNHITFFNTESFINLIWSNYYGLD